MRYVLHVFLAAHLGFFHPLAPQLATEQNRFDAELVGWPALDRQALVKYLRGLGLSEEDRRRMQHHIALLGSNDFQQRQKAMRSLLAESHAAMPLLRRALQDPDPERKRRAELCLGILEVRHDPARTEAALRLAGQWRVSGTTAALLAYLPCAGDDALLDEALCALLELGAAEERDLRDALAAPAPLTRGGAALALSQQGRSHDKELARSLQADHDSQVRLLASYVPAASGNRQALAVLVALVAEPAPVGCKAHHFLVRLADQSVPAVAWTDQSAARSRCSQAWQSWLASLDPRARLPVLQPAQELSPTWQARRLAQEFFDVLAGGRLEDLKRLTTVPFFLGGPLVLQTQDEFDRTFAIALDDRKKHPRSFPVEVLHTMRGESFLDLAPESEREFLAEYAQFQVRAVLVKGNVAGKEERAAVLIRFHHGQPRIFGIGHVNKARAKPQATSAAR